MHFSAWISSARHTTNRQSFKKVTCPFKKGSNILYYIYVKKIKDFFQWTCYQTWITGRVINFENPQLIIAKQHREYHQTSWLPYSTSTQKNYFLSKVQWIKYSYFQSKFNIVKNAWQRKVDVLKVWFLFRSCSISFSFFLSIKFINNLCFVGLLIFIRLFIQVGGEDD